MSRPVLRSSDGQPLIKTVTKIVFHVRLDVYPATSCSVVRRSLNKDREMVGGGGGEGGKGK